jgi:hypothetical protein
MPMFCKRPVVVEAVQWFPGVVIDGVHSEPSPGMPYDIAECVRDGLSTYIPKCGAIHTLEGWHIVTPGDWVITGVKGEKYPCKPDIFDLTYEPAP